MSLFIRFITTTIVLEWIFSGIGTQILFSVISFFIGGAMGYMIGSISTNKQNQKAGDNSTQNMSNTNNMSINNISNGVVNQAHGDIECNK